MSLPIENTPKIEPILEKTWLNALGPEFEKSYFQELRTFLKNEKAKGLAIYPPGPKIFSAFDLTPFDTVKVVILGQDPYHGESQAHGLSFSVPAGVRQPPSLQNIFKELRDDLALPIPVGKGDLSTWAKAGVFLLNAILTVQANQAASHQGKGWEQFTDAVIKTLSDKREGLVFILWGKFAQSKEKLIDTTKHHIIKSAHPSPLSAYNGFFGSKPFSKANEYLKSIGKEEVDWRVG
jgi:uracil-DNA glycosylase